MTDDTSGEPGVDPAELAAGLAAEMDDATTASDEENSPTKGTFVVTHADAESAMLRDTDTGQVHTLSENPDLES
ncbi:MAG: hypothetical protein J07HB67_00848, partial [halophilic archaeon J07HB67]